MTLCILTAYKAKLGQILIFYCIRQIYISYNCLEFYLNFQKSKPAILKSPVIDKPVRHETLSEIGENHNDMTITTRMDINNY